MQPKDIVKEVTRIEMSTKRLVDTLMAGAYHSVFKGQGIEFTEIREYFPGDDVRSIDWNVTARFGKPFMKEFIEERDLRVYFVCDYSGSTAFGTHTSKRTTALYILGTLAFSAVRNNDAVGLAVSTTGIERFVPARKGRRHVYRLLSEILRFTPWSRETSLCATFQSLCQLLKRRSLIFIVSDFFDSGFEQQLRRLTHKHDVVAIRIEDIHEQTIPPIGTMCLEDEETGEQIFVDTAHPTFQKMYRRLEQRETHRITRTLNKLRVDSILCSNGVPFQTGLKQFFKRRKRQVVW